MGERAESRGQRHLGDAHVRLGEQAARKIQARANVVLSRRCVEIGTEQSLNLLVGNPYRTCQRTEGTGFSRLLSMRSIALARTESATRGNREPTGWG